MSIVDCREDLNSCRLRKLAEHTAHNIHVDCREREREREREIYIERERERKISSARTLTLEIRHAACMEAHTCHFDEGSNNAKRNSTVANLHFLDIEGCIELHYIDDQMIECSSLPFLRHTFLPWLRLLFLRHCFSLCGFALACST